MGKLGSIGSAIEGFLFNQ